MFDVGDSDLTVPTSGNWVIKGCMTKWLRFLCFFLKIQKHDFLRFLRCCTRFLEHWMQVNGVIISVSINQSISEVIYPRGTMFVSNAFRCLVYTSFVRFKWVSYLFTCWLSLWRHGASGFQIWLHLGYDCFSMSLFYCTFNSCTVLRAYWTFLYRLLAHYKCPSIIIIIIWLFENSKRPERVRSNHRQLIFVPVESAYATSY